MKPRQFVDATHYPIDDCRFHIGLSFAQACSSLVRNYTA
jgi:hypothetical protein